MLLIFVMVLTCFLFIFFHSIETWPRGARYEGEYHQDQRNGKFLVVVVVVQFFLLIIKIKRKNFSNCSFIPTHLLFPMFYRNG